MDGDHTVQRCRTVGTGVSFARAIQQPAMHIWHGQDAQVTAAQDALRHRALCNQAARRGDYTTAMEHAMDPARTVSR